MDDLGALTQAAAYVAVEKREVDLWDFMISFYHFSW